MSKHNVKKKDTGVAEPSWDAAIADARQRIKDFQKAILVYKAAKKRGESWPDGTQDGAQETA